MVFLKHQRWIKIIKIKWVVFNKHKGMLDNNTMTRRNTKPRVTNNLKVSSMVPCLPNICNNNSNSPHTQQQWVSRTMGNKQLMELKKANKHLILHKKV